MAKKDKIVIFYPRNSEGINSYIDIVKKKLSNYVIIKAKYGDDTDAPHFFNVLVETDPKIIVIFGDHLLKELDPDRTIFQDKKISSINESIFIPIVDTTGMDSICEGIIKVANKLKEIRNGK